MILGMWVYVKISLLPSILLLGTISVIGVAVVSAQTTAPQILRIVEGPAHW